MVTWAVVRDIDLCGYNMLSVTSDPFGFDEALLEETLESMHRNKNRKILVVIDTRSKRSDGTDLNAEGSVSEIMPKLVLSHMHDRYGAYLFIHDGKGELTLPFRMRLGVTVKSFEKLSKCVEKAGLDEKRLDRFYDIIYSISYGMIALKISHSLIDAVRYEYERRGKKHSRDVRISMKGKVEDLFLGIPDPPDAGSFDPTPYIYEGEQSKGKGHIENAVFAKYGKRDAEARQVLSEIRNAWGKVRLFFGQAYCDIHPEMPEKIEIPVEEVISIMMFDHAKEAYEAGVPIDDIIC